MNKEMFFFIAIVKILFGNKNFYMINSHYNRRDTLYFDSIKNFISFAYLKKLQKRRRINDVISSLVLDVINHFLDSDERYEFFMFFRNFIYFYNFQGIKYVFEINDSTMSTLVKALRHFKKEYEIRMLDKYDKIHPFSNLRFPSHWS